MAKWYSVGIYVDGEPLDQCEVTGSSPRVAVNKAVEIISGGNSK